MSIREAFGELIESTVYKDICKEKSSRGAKYRVYKGRFINDKLKDLAMVAFLLEHNYGVNVTAPKRK